MPWRNSQPLCQSGRVIVASGAQVTQGSCIGQWRATYLPLTLHVAGIELSRGLWCSSCDIPSRLGSRGATHWQFCGAEAVHGVGLREAAAGAAATKMSVTSAMRVPQTRTRSSSCFFRGSGPQRPALLAVRTSFKRPCRPARPSKADNGARYVLAARVQSHIGVGSKERCTPPEAPVIRSSINSVRK